MNYLKLKKKLKLLSAELPETHCIRLHRALSWLKCAEEHKDNLDLQFITLWIAYNSCYAIDENQESLTPEREQSNDFVSKLVKHDLDNRFFDLLWNAFSGPVRLLIENKYVFKPFWEFQRKQVKDWKKLHYKSINDAHKYLSGQQVPQLLELVLDRLYTLRNQLVHGGATYQSKLNRSQVKDACSILKLLVPIIIDIMIQNGKEDWGRVHYPVISQGA